MKEKSSQTGALASNLETIQPSILDESRGYLEYYGQVREAALSDQDLFETMVSRYPDWISHQQFLLVG